MGAKNGMLRPALNTVVVNAEMDRLARHAGVAPMRSNPAMQRTASKPATDVLRVFHPPFGCVAHFTGLAVADLVYSLDAKASRVMAVTRSRHHGEIHLSRVLQARQHAVTASRCGLRRQTLSSGCHSRLEHCCRSPRSILTLLSMRHADERPLGRQLVNLHYDDRDTNLTMQWSERPPATRSRFALT